MAQHIKGYSAAQDIFSVISEISGQDICSLSLNGPDRDLRKPVHSQLAVFGASAAYWHLLQGQERFSVLAGHSLGFYSALYAAGSLSLGDAVRLIVSVQELISASAGEREGAMASVIGLKTAEVERICAETGDVHVSNINSATQTVISGYAGEVANVCDRALQEGALQVKDLAIPYPLHSPLMDGIEKAISPLVQDMEIKRPVIPVLSHLDGRLLQQDGIAAVLCSQLTHRVDWLTAVLSLTGSGVKRFIEIGPSLVLSRLVRWIDRDAEPVGSEEIFQCQNV